MPTYGYKCGKCGHKCELLERITARKKKLACEKCGGKMERTISGGIGVVFNGEGFHCTDYGKKFEEPKDG